MWQLIHGQVWQCQCRYFFFANLQKPNLDKTFPAKPDGEQQKALIWGQLFIFLLHFYKKLKFLCESFEATCSCTDPQKRDRKKQSRGRRNTNNKGAQQFVITSREVDKDKTFRKDVAWFDPQVQVCV